ncbi:hypothetical protein TcasGA2_TC034893 [Tribolium castaneum]|uniref:Uncharacterized protein n=1 Tax=Tribolium castaneum TaxID=7070 RepID=A0A139WBX0_TRICA|nr:hypothetical protein TcasGA2_TC034893 [Tribolium castaneum]
MEMTRHFHFGRLCLRHKHGYCDQVTQEMRESHSVIVFRHPY